MPLPPAAIRPPHTMPTEITMPQLSDTMTEGTLVKWYKAEGDKVKAGEKIADIETDKAVMEMESFESGTLAVMLAKEGDKVLVGAAIGVLATGSEKIDDIKKQRGATPSRAANVPQNTVKREAEMSSQPTAGGAVGTATLEDFSKGEVRDFGDTAHGATHEDFTVAGPETDVGHEARVRVSPLARRVASDRGIDLKLVKGSGPGGRIVQRDINSYMPPAKGSERAPGRGSDKRSEKPAFSLAPKLQPGTKEPTPLSKMRTVIAQRLQQSKQQIPHFYETIDIDVTDLSKLREQMNKALEAEGIRISIADLIAKALAHALLINPNVNAHFLKDQIVKFGDVHLGMAVALPDGLIVPVLRNLNQLSLREIRTKSADLVDRARKQQLKQNEMSGATFTVSNLGTYGIREFSAIINPPEVGILAIGSAEKRVVVVNDIPVVRTMMTVTLSADHRAVDGAGAAEFLKSLKTILEEPGMMLV